ncbi:MAG: cobalamin-dependent protein [Eubacteriales bacterium]
MNTTIFEMVKTGKMNDIAGAVAASLEAGEPALDTLDTMVSAMAEIGEGFKNGTVFIPEMLLGAMTMQAGVAVLKPHLGSGEANKLGKFVMGTVYGDLHDVGKNLVIMMVESAGFEVVDLGIDVSVEKFVNAVESDEAVNVVGVSALLTTTLPAMEKVVEALNASPARSRIKVMVGGAPVTQAFADKIGADAYTADAASAAEKAAELAK